MPRLTSQAITLLPASAVLGRGVLTDTSFYRDVRNVLEPAGVFFIGGLIVGFLAAAIHNTARPDEPVSYGEWTACVGGLLALGGALLQLFGRLGVS